MLFSLHYLEGSIYERKTIVHPVRCVLIGVFIAAVGDCDFQLVSEYNKANEQKT